MLVYAPPKKGKTIFSLSMAKAGPIGVLDMEYGCDWYLQPHPTIETPSGSPTVRAALRPHVAELLGINPSTLIYWLQTQDIGMAEAFLEAMAGLDDVIGITLDSMSVHWDLVSDFADRSKPGGLAWADPKRMERRLQYKLLSSRKHYIVTAHLQYLYDSQMKIQGVQAWTEKKLPHWIDLIGRFEKDSTKGALPRLVIEGERSGGALPAGTTIENPNFEMLLNLMGDTIPQTAPILPDEGKLLESNRLVVVGN